MNLASIIGGIAVMAAGVVLILKGQVEVGTALTVAGAGEVGAKAYLQTK